MPHPLPALVALAAAPVIALAMHSATAHAIRIPAAHAAATLPNNLCASCHGGGRVASVGARPLASADLAAARTFLEDAPQG